MASIRVKRKKNTRPSHVYPGRITDGMPTADDIALGYVRDPGAIRVQDPTAGLWQGRMITPDILAPETLRYAAARSQVFNTAMRFIQREVVKFARRPLFDGDIGFRVVPKLKNKRMTAAEEKEAEQIETFLLKTGRVYNPDRHDTLREYLVKQVYNRLVYDRMVTQLSWGTITPYEFVALEGSTIIKTDPNVYIPQTERGVAVSPVTYIQIHKDQVWAEFNSSELIFGICNPSPSLETNGYGTPELMELIEPVTLEILILTYLDRLLTQGSVPDGLLIMTSMRNGQSIESISLASGQSNEDLARIIRNQVAGAQNAGRLAVLRLRPGEDAKLILNNRDLSQMPFVQMYEIVQNQISRKLGLDPAQVGIVQGSIKNSFTDSDSKSATLRNANNRVVTDVLLSISDTQLNPLIDYLNADFCIQWQGIDNQLEQERLNLEAMKQNMGILTLNQLLTHQNLDTYPKGEKYWWADVPLHPMIFEAEASKRELKTKKTRGASEEERIGGIGGQAGQKRPQKRDGTLPDSSDE